MDVLLRRRQLGEILLGPLLEPAPGVRQLRALGAHLFGHRVGPRLRRRLQLRERVRQRLHELLEVPPMPRAEPHVVLGEVFERIVAEVRQPRVALRVQPGRHAQLVLIDAPRDAGLLQPLGKRLPAHRRVEIRVLIPHARLRLRVGFFTNRSRPQMQPVRRGAGERRAEILIANRERIGERVVERNVLAVVIAERERLARVVLVAGGLHLEPAVVPAVIARERLVDPAVRQAADPRRLCVLDVQAERRVGFARGIRLEPDRIAVRQRDRARIVEAAHAAQRAVAVIERAVLLHEDDDMLRVEKGAARRGIDGQRPRNRSRDRPGHTAPRREQRRLLQKIATRIHGPRDAALAPAIMHPQNAAAPQ